MNATRSGMSAGLVAAGWVVLIVPMALAADKPDARQTAAEVDRLLAKELQAAGATPAPRCSDEDFLRRVTFDLAGTAPAPRDVTLFGLDPDADKRARRIDRLLDSDDFARNQARYWRDVIFSRASDMRSQIGRGAFETWMADQLRANRPWDQVVTDLLTATGDVLEDGRTALIFAQGANTEDVAAEVSRIFLGVQIQCANCHDHPTDQWKREQFHQLAAFLPRIALRPKQDGGRIRSFEVVSFDRERGRGPFAENPERAFRFLDRNRDGKLTKTEVAETPLARAFDFILQNGDKDKDGTISLAEIKELPRPPMPASGSTEHYMTDPSNPASRGKRIDPAFFLGGDVVPTGLNDHERRAALARFVTSPENEWFAKALVNRVWAELLGEGFSMPIDDMGPERTARYPEVLDALSRAFVASGYDVKWLFRTIANTQAYQRQIRAQDRSGQTPLFASATPTRLRSDQVFDALLTITGATEPQLPTNGMGAYRRVRSPRFVFNALFGFDPSTPQQDITGEVPQALFLMNSPQVNALIRADGRTRLAQLLRDFPQNDDAVSELYLLVLSREPSDTERRICLDYIATVAQRGEAFEDLMWTLLNSSEFLSKR